MIRRRKWKQSGGRRGCKRNDSALNSSEFALIHIDYNSVFIKKENIPVMELIYNFPKENPFLK
jgi:hypothetical protein